MCRKRDLSRRDWLGVAAAGLVASSAPELRGSPTAPVAPVSIGKCPDYEHGLADVLGRQFDEIGGIGKLVAGKTVAIKLNLTGGGRLGSYKPGQTHWVHPSLVGTTCHLLAKAGAKRIRLLEGADRGGLEDKMLNGGWDVNALRSSAPIVEFIDTNRRTGFSQYGRFKVAKPYIYPGFDLNKGYEEADVFINMSKLKEHEECGITLCIKNSFGMTPDSIYGDDAGVDEPNERARRGREAVLHYGQRQPSKSAPQEVDFASERFEGHRVPRICVDLVAARPPDISIIDGIETAAGGEGPWLKSFRYVNPQVLIVGRNVVCTDAVATAVMGYNPRAGRGEAPFRRLTPPEHPGLPVWADNPMLLAEAAGLGSADLSRIDVRGVPLKSAVFDFAKR